MPSQRSLNTLERNRRIREAALDGHSVAWIAATFGVSDTTVYKTCRGLDLTNFGSGSDEPPAEWEVLVANGSDMALIPSDEWLDALEDADLMTRGPCVYFVQQHGTRFVKIGVSSAAYIRDRVGQLQIGNPAQLAVRRLVKGDFNVEAVLHAAFADRRIRGEWFDCDDRLAKIARIEL